MTLAGLDNAGEAEKGTVLVADLRGSTFGAEMARKTGRLVCFREDQEAHLTTLLNVLEEASRAIGVEILDISYGGDGVTVVTSLHGDGLDLALSLQEACDLFAARLIGQRPWYQGGETGTPFRWATGIGMATGEVIRLEGRPLETKPFLRDLGFRRRFTGNAFNMATRIEAKAKPGKACFSPLVDEETHARSTLTGLRTFPVGHFVIDRKASLEVPRLNPFQGQPPGYSRLYSVVRVGSVLEEAVDLFEKAVARAFNRRMPGAFEALIGLERFLREKQERILADHGDIALWRWEQAVRHYSYLPGSG